MNFDAAKILSGTMASIFGLSMGRGERNCLGEWEGSVRTLVRGN